MKQPYLILLNLIAIFEIMAIKTNYVLVEIVKEQVKNSIVVLCNLIILVLFIYHMLQIVSHFLII